MADGGRRLLLMTVKRMKSAVRTRGIDAWTGANRYLRPFEREVIRAGGNRAGSFRVQKVRLPPQLRDPLARPDRNTFVVELDRMTTDCGFSFAPDGWHPFVVTLREHAERAMSDYAGSTLHRVHTTFQPRTVQELLLEDVVKPLEPLHRWPVIRRLFRRVWAVTPWLAARELRAAQSPTMKQREWLYYGPSREEFLRSELGRLIGVYESIRRLGYQQDLAAESQINGYFLCRGDDYRFVVLNGNHRVAALRVLGGDTVPVTIRDGHPTVVHFDSLRQWSQDCGGVYPMDVARRLFDRMFDESGRGKAERLGLLPGRLTSP
jgi:hypothetical protein